MDRRSLHTGFYAADPAGTEMASSRKAASEAGRSYQRSMTRAGAPIGESGEARCRAVLRNGQRCKREGQPVFDERSGRYLYYCIAHRRMLREAGQLHPVRAQGARE